MRWLDSIINSIDMSLSKIWEILKDREAQRAAVHRVTKCQISSSSVCSRFKGVELMEGL